MTLPAYAMNVASFPEMYERWLVGPLFQPFAETVLDRANLRSGDRVLDIACGTGIVARLALNRLSGNGRVVGIDVSPQMLAVAHTIEPRIRYTWRSVDGDAQSLPLWQQEIDRIDDAIVRLLAERAMVVKDAARFKRDPFQVSAPERQAQVYARVRALAERHNPGFNGGFEGLPDVVEAAYRALVAGYTACEARYFGETEPL